MKTINILSAAKRCGILLALGCLAGSGFAQIDTFGPGIRITSPADHATFFAPVNVPIFAYVRAQLSPALARVTVTNLEFYAGTNDLGPGVDISWTNSALGFDPYEPPQIEVGLRFRFIWTNPPPGIYALTAVSHANFDIGRTSAPVTINVLPGSITANPTDVFDIVATDPIAIERTNSFWPWSGLTNVTPAWVSWPPRQPLTFTNWGPKDAFFTVRRFGDASADATISYDIGGTASNGVDYATLPGNVTVPAGDVGAIIPIVPIPHGTTNFAKTVVLTLLPDTNRPPDYLIGPHDRAAVLILDSWRRPLPFVLPDHSFHLSASGPDGAWFSVQNSSDLQNWSSIVTNQAVQGSIDYIDQDAPGNPTRFYRIVPMTNAPAD